MSVPLRDKSTVLRLLADLEKGNHASTIEAVMRAITSGPRDAWWNDSPYDDGGGAGTWWTLHDFDAENYSQQMGGFGIPVVLTARFDEEAWKPYGGINGQAHYYRLAPGVPVEITKAKATIPNPDTATMMLALIERGLDLSSYQAGDWNSDGDGIEIDLPVGRLPKTAVVPIDQVVYIAEGAMERAGKTGRHWHLAVGNPDKDPEVKADQERLAAFCMEAARSQGHPHFIRAYPSDYILDTDGGPGVKGMTTSMGGIVVRPFTTDLTILHEVAHVVTNTREGRGGHGLAFCEVARDLYEKYLAAAAADIFWNLVSTQFEKTAGPASGIVPERVRADPPRNPYAPRPVQVERVAEGDIRDLHGGDETKVRRMLKLIEQGKVELERKQAPLEECFSADAGSALRILMYLHIDGSWRVFYVGYHQYGEAQRRMAHVAYRTADLRGSKLWWRLHPDHREFMPETATSTPFYPVDGEVQTQSGFSALKNPWHLWLYVNHQRIGGGDVVGFTGHEVGKGNDSEPLVVPDMGVVQRYSWDEFERELADTPLPDTPKFLPWAPAVYNSWETYYRRFPNAPGEVSWDDFFKTAMPTSWRPMTEVPFWDDYDAVISGEGGAAGRKHYEVFANGMQVASRPSLAEAKAAIEERYGPVSWTQVRSPRVTTDHYFYGPTDEFTSPGVLWVADLPQAKAVRHGAQATA